MGWYAIRDKEKAEKRPWKGAWLQAMERVQDSSGPSVFFAYNIGNLAGAQQFSSLEQAEDFAFTLTTKDPDYIGRLVIHHVEYGTSGRRLLIDKAEG